MGDMGDMGDFDMHPDGRRMVKFDGSRLFVMDLTFEERTPLWEQVELGGYITSVVFSPNGDCIATGSDGNHVSIWDSDTGEKINEYSAPDSVVFIEYLANDVIMCCCNDGSRFTVRDLELTRKIGRYIPDNLAKLVNDMLLDIVQF